MLQQVVDSRFVNQSIVRSYTRSFNGFAANLTAQEKQELAGHEDVVSIFPSRTFQPLTTRSWDFMGLPENVHRNLTVESDIIIGVLILEFGLNRKVSTMKASALLPRNGKEFVKAEKTSLATRARYYNSLQPSNDTARDREGHGTHTASTAAGNYVKDASFYGIAKGTGRGGVPSARIAAYKVCGLIGCLEMDILAAFDDAIADGVDILSISLGPEKPLQFKDDSVAIGAFHALQKGILVLQSAGNSGDYKTVASIVPWIFTVAASSTDRGIVTKVVIGNGTAFTGKAINSFSLAGSSVPVVYGKNVTKTCSEDDARQCLPICLEPSLVKGKIILCDNYLGVNNAFRVGAVGAVTSLNAFTPQGRHLVHISFIVPLAASHLSDQNFNDLQSYYAATITPKVDIQISESVKNIDAPGCGLLFKRAKWHYSRYFEDVTAPGIEILAAFSPLAPPSGFSSDKRSVNYSILSGTSMSCPHAAGAAAYVKSFHPNWSPSAIKSALMTTAWRMDPTKDSLAEFSYGAGHIDPVKAVDPGLVYETFTEDYINMLCSLGYDTATLRKILGVNSTCPTGMQITPKDLNYPSMARRITTNDSTVLTFSENFTRTVTNVGLGNSTYKVTTSTSPNYNISVKPDILSFRTLNERKSFEVIISGKITGEMVSAELEWSDGVHRVRNPIIVYPDSL
ncbi:Subtilisin-like protease SBT4.3 [Sesamum angolense]|uniref:Subtilisin-like protease SBT4.3 n=1 Tax=Sesamum angolense TaxID=2727404 RepID=A0AAE2BYZ9_9LAMI|nr:Subtilisin-like protease SBT4.3 [Sesamum angolense]